MKRTQRHTFVLASLLGVGLNLAISFVIGDGLGSAFADEKKIILNAVSDSPDPFSVPVDHTVQFQAQFDVRQTDGLGAESDKTGKQFFIQHTVRVTDANTGAEKVLLKGETQIIPPPGKEKDKFVSVQVVQEWDGRDGQGNVVPDGQYRYEVQGVFVRVDQKLADKDKDKVKVIDTSDKLSGDIVLDGTPPIISGLVPADGSILGTATPALSGSYSDNLTGVDALSVMVLLDGQNVTGQANVTRTGFSLALASPLGDGSHTLVVRVRDNAENEAQATVQFMTDITPPVISNLSPQEGSKINSARPVISAGLSDATSGVNVASVKLSLDGADVVATVTGSSVSFTPTSDLSDGSHVVRVEVADRAGNRATAQSTFTTDVTPPVISNLVPQNGSTTDNARPSISAGLSDATSGVDVGSVRLSLDGVNVTATVTESSVSFTPTSDLSDGPHTAQLEVADRAGNRATTQSTFTVQTTAVPPDPATVAPALDGTVATTVYAATQFLYTGARPIQTGVIAESIEVRRATVLRGKVGDRSGNPLSEVTVTVLGHPEFGQTLTRLDGMFDMVVNGGGLLTVGYQKEGYLPAQRQVDAPWQDYTWLPDVVMTPLDAQVTSVDLTASAMQVARGSEVTDASGTRRATVLFPQGTSATMGSTPLTSLHVRATEYTVGPKGPDAMPAELPPTSAYTYAVELSVDEAVSAGASQVTFSQPVAFYVENFLNFPVGAGVPTGYYDRDRAAWVPSPDGRVIKVLSISNGLAELDTNGDGAADGATVLTALEVTDAERGQLASLYSPGQGLWRVPITHFTSYDCNYGVSFPVGATTPQNPPPTTPAPSVDKDCDNPGSIIGPYNQTLGEMVDVSGTPFTLHYSSDRTPGRKAAYTLDISLSGATVPSGLKRIELMISVAGKFYTQTFNSPAPNLSYTFTWDGKDAYGRMLQGAQPVTIRIGYVYSAFYNMPPAMAKSFGFPGGTPGNIPARDERTRWQGQFATIGTWDVQAQGIGGWTLNVHHAYSPISGELYTGDGQIRTAADMRIITTVAGNGQSTPPRGVGAYSGDNGPATHAALNGPRGLAVGPDGSIYIADSDNHRIRRVDPNGIITTVAGSGAVGLGMGGFGGDGGPAVQAQLNWPHDVAVGPDGSVFIADYRNHRVRRVGPDGIITTVAGGGTGGYGGPATNAKLYHAVTGVALDMDGNLYIVEQSRVSRVSADGILNTIAGSFLYGESKGDGGPATQAQFYTAWDVAVGPDGSLYVTDRNRVRRITVNGIISTVAGGGSLAYPNGVLALQAQFSGFLRPAAGPDGSLYLASSGGGRVYQVNPEGVVTTMAGTDYHFGYAGEGGPAAAAQLGFPQGIALGPDGSLYTSANAAHRISRIAPPMPGFSGDDIVIASEDGSEVWRFDATGRHLETLNAITGVRLYRFTYGGAGRLTEVEDVNGNTTRIERDASGNPTAIVAPFGQRTSLSLDSNGYLAGVTNPAGEIIRFSYSSEGLLNDLTDPRGNITRFTYSTLGLLTRDEDPVGGFSALERTDKVNGFEVALSTALNRKKTYLLENLPTGETRRTTTNSGCVPCSKTDVLIGTDGSSTATVSDGTVTTQVAGPDPRFGMQAPIAKTTTVKTPGGRTFTMTMDRSATLADPDNLLSLKTLTQTVSVNGRASSSSFDITQSQIVTTSPAGRQVVSLLDAKGRVVENRMSGLTPIQFTYDTQGRLMNTAQGARTVAFTYDAQGRLTSITNPLSQTVSFDYDATGRTTGQTLPDGRQVLFAYDANGNLTSITPPGRPAHAFTYTPANVGEEYRAPNTGAGSTATHYTYNLDRQLTRLNPPDGRTTDFSYDTLGRLSSLTLPHGQVSYAYHPSTGNLTTVVAPDGGTISYAYDGSLPISTVWMGGISGSVSRTFNNDFGITSQSVNGGNTVNFQYDADGLLTQAGALTLSRNPQNGLLTGTVLGRRQSTGPVTAGHPCSRSSTRGMG